MEAPWTLEVKEVLNYFATDPVKGLSTKQVQKHREQYGPNEIPPEAGWPFSPLSLTCVCGVCHPVVVCDLFACVISRVDFFFSHSILEACA